MSNVEAKPPQELDGICCERAGIGKTRWWSGNNSEPEYPPVSTNWEAAGRLMEALASNGIKYQIDCDPIIQPRHRALVQTPEGKFDCRSHYSGPMALALAVVALAKQEADAWMPLPGELKEKP